MEVENIRIDTEGKISLQLVFTETEIEEEDLDKIEELYMRHLIIKPLHPLKVNKWVSMKEEYEKILTYYGRTLVIELFS